MFQFIVETKGDFKQKWNLNNNNKEKECHFFIVINIPLEPVIRSNLIKFIRIPGARDVYGTNRLYLIAIFKSENFPKNIR